MIKTISFCGIDGSGKTTQLKLFKEYLNENNINSKIIKPTFYPYEIYKDKFNSEEILCLGTAFDFLRNNDLINGQNDDCIKLYDRHKICYLALAYAFKVNNLDLLSKIYSVIPSPDIIVYFDTDVSTALDRIMSRGKKISNRETYEILSRFKEGYEYFITLEKDAQLVRIDSNLSVEKITNEIINKVYKKIK